jgi:hypothetical protein
VIVVVLPDPAPGEDADRSTHRFDRAPLLGIQVHEDAFGVHMCTVKTAWDGGDRKDARNRDATVSS